MAEKLLGSAIQSGTITSTQLTNELLTNISQGGGPKVSSLIYPGDDTAANTVGGQIIQISGSGFASNSLVYINGNVVPSVTYNSSSNLIFTTPALSAATYPVYVINPEDGATAIFVPGLQVSGEPTWITDATLPQQQVASAWNISLSANSDSNVTYALANGSSLPSGISLAANGLISGTFSSPPTEDTTYNFTVVAIDDENQDASRTFSILIIIRAPLTAVEISASYETFYVSDVLEDGASGIITFQGNKPQNWGFVYFGVTTLTQSSFRTPSATSTINNVAGHPSESTHTLASDGVIWYLDFDDYPEYTPDLVRAHIGYAYTDWSAQNQFRFGWSRSGSSVTVTAINPSTNAIFYTRTASGIVGNPRVVLSGVASSAGAVLPSVNVVSQSFPEVFFNP